MPKPVTPFVGCDVFVVNEKKELLLIQRADNGFWAMPGGCQDLGETAQECAQRECLEETGLEVICTDLIGVYSSTSYEYVNYPWKDNEFTHLVFLAEIKGGKIETSSETLKVEWFELDKIPELSDGHDIRINHGIKFINSKEGFPYFE
jgi:ADP-ribose pyrophosphatase YjhB (NUDIX family)